MKTLKLETTKYTQIYKTKSTYIDLSYNIIVYYTFIGTYKT